MTGVLGDAPQSGALGGSGNSGAPALASSAGPTDPLPSSALSVWGWPLAIVAAVFLFSDRRR
jgi:MYXO-CTERM domain-containing protein